MGGAAGKVEFDDDYCAWPYILHIGGGTCVIAYGGPAGDGFLVSLQIDAAGQITLLDELEYDAIAGTTPNMVNVSENQYAIAYIGDGADGFVCTPTIETPSTAMIRHLMLLGAG